MHFKESSSCHSLMDQEAYRKKSDLLSEVVSDTEFLDNETVEYMPVFTKQLNLSFHKGAEKKFLMYLLVK